MNIDICGSLYFKSFLLFSRMKPPVLTTAILLSVIVFFSVAGWMSTMRSELVIPACPTNALYSLESAWSKQRVEEVISCWKKEGKLDLAIRFNKIDLLLFIGYIPFLYFGLRRLALIFPNLFGKALKLLTLLTILTGIFEIMEGVAIYVWLSGHVDTITPIIIGITSFLKFVVVIPIALMVIGGFLFALIKKGQ